MPLTCQVAQELRRVRAIDMTVVAGDRDGHALLHAEVAVLQLHDLGLRGGDGQDAAGAGGQDGVELLHAEHAQVGDRESAYKQEAKKDQQRVR